ncbi:MAG: hypothetical protein AAGA83_20210 [Cyanobacteria bacterium P01_F01_bin.116]
MIDWLKQRFPDTPNPCSSTRFTPKILGLGLLIIAAIFSPSVARAASFSPEARAVIDLFRDRLL